jgi:hypothetical protein
MINRASHSFITSPCNRTTHPPNPVIPNLAAFWRVRNLLFEPRSNFTTAAQTYFRFFSWASGKSATAKRSCPILFVPFKGCGS